MILGPSGNLRSWTKKPARKVVKKNAANSENKLISRDSL